MRKSEGVSYSGDKIGGGEEHTTHLSSKVTTLFCERPKLLVENLKLPGKGLSVRCGGKKSGLG